MPPRRANEALEHLGDRVSRLESELAVSVFSPAANEENDANKALWTRAQSIKDISIAERYKYRQKLVADYFAIVAKEVLEPQKQGWDNGLRKMVDLNEDFTALERTQFTEFVKLYTDYAAKCYSTDIAFVRWKDNGWLDIKFHFAHSEFARAMVSRSKASHRNVTFVLNSKLRIKTDDPAKRRRAVRWGDNAGGGGGGNNNNNNNNNAGGGGAAKGKGKGNGNGAKGNNGKNGNGKKGKKGGKGGQGNGKGDGKGVGN
jgi:hypothetical protein